MMKRIIYSIVFFALLIPALDAQSVQELERRRKEALRQLETTVKF